MSRYRIKTPGRYLTKGKDKAVVSDGLYKGKDLNGWCSPSHRVVVIDTKTKDTKIYFPGQKIEAIVERVKKKPAKKKTPQA